MLKSTDAYEFVHRKITRNKILIEIFKLYDELLGFEIIFKNELQSFYKKQQSDIHLMNEIEMLQTAEYTLDRETIINNMTSNIGIFKLTGTSLEIKNKIIEIKNMITEKVNVMNNIQLLIPIDGIATNYHIINKNYERPNPSQTCTAAALLH